MKIVATLLGYLAASAGLFGGLVSAVLWLISPDDPTIKQDARVAPIPPRIAESIERKMAPVPAAAPEPVKAVVNELVMKEADVALTQPLRRSQERELNSQTPIKRKPPRDERGLASRETSSPQQASSASVRAISTGRTDFPY